MHNKIVIFLNYEKRKPIQSMFLKKIFPIMPSLDVTNINEMPHFLLTCVINLINKMKRHMKLCSPTHFTFFNQKFASFALA